MACIDLCLQEHQGLCCATDRLLVIMNEFTNLHLKCVQVPLVHSYTFTTLTELLLGLHCSVGRNERKDLVDSTSDAATILRMFGQVISEHRQCKTFMKKVIFHAPGKFL